MKNPRSTLLRATAVCLAVAGMAWAAANRPNSTDAEAADDTKPAKAPAVAVDAKPLSASKRADTSLSPIVKKVGPSIVTVYSTKNVKAPPTTPMPFFNIPGMGPDDEGNFVQPRRQAPREYKQEGLGSGVIVSRDGHILTNNHVVDGADEVKVQLADDKKDYVAKVIGRDPKTDIAVLKIDAEDLPAATLGDSEKVEVGDMILAVGNPFGIGQTVTVGIVSAKGRGGMGIEDYEDFIQTDAAINPGNSGGALVDAEGRVVGIATAILSRTGGNHGVGFAVPMNLARNVMDQLVAKGHVVRGYLGVVIQDLNGDLAREFGVDNRRGALVSDVSKDGAADEAGIEPGDVIVEFDRHAVPDSRNLKLMVARALPGEKVPVTVLREGKEKSLKVTLKELPEKRVPSTERAEAGEAGDALSGVAVGDLDNNARRQFNLPRDLKGAVVVDVDPDSASAKAGLQPGDVIQEINRKPVTSAEEAVNLTEKRKQDRTVVRVWREGNSRYVVVDEARQK